MSLVTSLALGTVMGRRGIRITGAGSNGFINV